MKRVILCPNPYRDSELTVAKRSRELLEGLGFETVVCLPFSREGYDDQLGVPIRQLQQEIKRWYFRQVSYFLFHFNRIF